MTHQGRSFPDGVVVIVGLPAGLIDTVRKSAPRSLRVEEVRLVGRDRVHLAPRDDLVVNMIDRFADGYRLDQVTLVVLPYAKLSRSVTEHVRLYQTAGARVVFPKANCDGWPSRAHAVEGGHGGKLVERLRVLVSDPMEDDEERTIRVALLAGLASHRKLGRNCHSSEDDLWKERGKNLSGSDRRRLISHLKTEGVLGERVNDSMGGKGRVYWIADVGLARHLYPELNRYFPSERA